MEMSEAASVTRNEGPLLPERLVAFLRALASSQLRTIIAKQVRGSPVARPSDILPPSKARNVDFHIKKIPIQKHRKPVQMISDALPVNTNASAGWISRGPPVRGRRVVPKHEEASPSATELPEPVQRPRPPEPLSQRGRGGGQTGAGLTTSQRGWCRWPWTTLGDPLWLSPTPSIPSLFLSHDGLLAGVRGVRPLLQGRPANKVLCVPALYLKPAFGGTFLK